MSGKAKFYVTFGLLILASLILAASRPFAYQKLNTLVPVDGFEPLQSLTKSVDIANYVGNTPYREGPAPTVDPEKKYKLTIEEGLGNCSERSFGLAWKLRQSAIDLQIVHLMRSSTFVHGQGHTLLRIPYDDRGQNRVVLVDLLEGGLPSSGGELLDIEDLTRGAIVDFELQSLTQLRDDESPYYGEFLDPISVGYIPAREIDRYFRFIERIYLPLGNDLVEKYFYDGLALIFGVLPKIYVPDYDVLVREHRIEKWLHWSALWVQRAALLLIPGILAFEVTRRFGSPRNPVRTRG